jgi:multisubunit Na+/H+ antiporter MnhB subunit
VNVILVDFRALDTLGEITVIALAAVGVHMLWVKGKPSTKSDSGTPPP